jgi:hypothetical protein
MQENFSKWISITHLMDDVHTLEFAKRTQREPGLIIVRREWNIAKQD